MDEPIDAVDIAAVRLTAHFSELGAVPGEFGTLATLLSPEGVRVEMALPGGERRTARTSGRDLVCSYAFIAAGNRAPWCLGDGLVETDGERVIAPGSPPLTGSVADFRRSLGALVADLFAELAAADADPVPAVDRCLGPAAGVDAAAVYEQVMGTAWS